MAATKLYFFPYLHQTTTWVVAHGVSVFVVFLSLSTSNHNRWRTWRATTAVVFLSLSTSNHNADPCAQLRVPVVFLSLSTSNHNAEPATSRLPPVVFLSLSTSNHNTVWLEKYKYVLYFFPYLHQTTTRMITFFPMKLLYFFPYLHQTTTAGATCH